MSFPPTGGEVLDVPVLIVGGGPVGLTASILLSQLGVHSLLEERHPGMAVLPKAQGLIFGAAYESAAVIPDGTPPPRIDDPVTQYVPSARPGGRAPHVWLERDGARVSTIDLFGPRFVLLTGPRGSAWRAAARRIATRSRPPLIAYTIVGDGELTDVDSAWPDTYQIDDDGAILVRPDGYVAWRSRGGADDPLRSLEAALDGVLGRVAHAAQELPLAKEVGE